MWYIWIVFWLDYQYCPEVRFGERLEDFDNFQFLTILALPTFCKSKNLWSSCELKFLMRNNMESLKANINTLFSCSIHYRKTTLSFYGIPVRKRNKPNDIYEIKLSISSDFDICEYSTTKYILNAIIQGCIYSDEIWMTY